MLVMSYPLGKTSTESMETSMTASCHRIHSLIQTESVSQFQTVQWIQGWKEKGGETTRQTQKQKGRQGTDILEDSEKTRAHPRPGKR